MDSQIATVEPTCARNVSDLLKVSVFIVAGLLFFHAIQSGNRLRREAKRH